MQFNRVDIVKDAVKKKRKRRKEEGGGGGSLKKKQPGTSNRNAATLPLHPPADTLILLAAGS